MGPGGTVTGLLPSVKTILTLFYNALLPSTDCNYKQFRVRVVKVEVDNFFIYYGGGASQLPVTSCIIAT